MQFAFILNIHFTLVWGHATEGFSRTYCRDNMESTNTRADLVRDSFENHHRDRHREEYNYNRGISCGVVARAGKRGENQFLPHRFVQYDNHGGVCA